MSIDGFEKKTPSEKAKMISEMVNKHGNAKKASEILGISEATASRYLKLLKLPTSELMLIDAGKKPIRNVNRPSKVSPLIGERLMECLDELARVRFANLEQLRVYLGQSESTMRDTLARLVSRNLVDKNEEYSPHVFSLTTKGCNLAGVQKPKHFMSGAAIHQRLLRNRIELEIRDKNKHAAFISRTKCWDMGLFPAVGEHALRYEHEGKSKLSLVVIDDYGMEGTRLLRILERRHDPEGSYVKAKVTLKWLDVVDALLVYTTLERQLVNFKNVFEKNKKVFPKTTAFRYVKPIWEVA